MKILEKKLKKYYKNYYYHELGLPNWEDWVSFRISEENFELEKISRLEKITGKFKNKKLLDVGCGTGGFLKIAKQKGAIIFGLEPEKTAVDICRIKGLANIKLGFSEKLPFQNDYFDIVYCYTVLEHVDNVSKSLEEMVRVTKKNGKVYIQTPNYLSCYEGHYKVFWLPLFPKKLASIYLKLRGRNSNFIKTINYITPNLLKKYLLKLPVTYKFIKHEDKRTKGILSIPLLVFYTAFNIDPQIEILIKKNK